MKTNPALPSNWQASAMSTPANGSENPRREDVAWQLETALNELSYGNLLNVMVHSKRAAEMALRLCEAGVVIRTNKLTEPMPVNPNPKQAPGYIGASASQDAVKHADRQGIGSVKCRKNNL